MITYFMKTRYKIKEETMKYIQGSYLTGYVTLQVKGENPELFFRDCLDYGIVIWNIKKISSTECRGNIKLRDINVIKQVNRATHFKLSFVDKKGYPFVIKKFLRKKEVIIGLFICLFLIVFLSNVLWKITISGLPLEIEEKIHEKLTDYGVHQGSWMFTLHPSSELQQKLLHDIPELLWVGVERKGTTLILEGVEKTSVKKETVPGPRHLVATKKGVIKKIYVTKGQPQKKVNDFVDVGDILVSGVVNSVEDDSEEGNENKLELVPAEADITAQTWYEVNVSVPLTTSQEILTGNQKKRYFIRMGNLQLPIWNFKTPDYDHIHQELNENDVYLLKWKIPLHIMESVLSEKKYHKVERTKEEATQIGVMQAKRDLLLRLGPGAKILSENILQDTLENGKVNLQLYFTVEEDIVKAEPITQGD